MAQINPGDPIYFDGSIARFTNEPKGKMIGIATGRQFEDKIEVYMGDSKVIFPVTHTTQSFCATITQWQQVPKEKPDGHRTVFTLEKPFEHNTLEVYLNGLRMQRGFDFFEGLL